MNTEALIETYLRSAGWTKVNCVDAEETAIWDHDQVEVLKTTEEATVITQEWEDLAFDDDGPEPEEDPHKDDWMQYLDEPDSEPDCED